MKKKTLKERGDRVYLTEQEIAAACQYFALSNMALLEGAKQAEQPNKDGKYNLQQLTSRGDMMLQDAEGSPSIIEEVGSWRKEFVGVRENDYVFTEWQKVKDQFEFWVPKFK